MAWPKIFKRKKFSHASRIGWLSKVAVNPVFSLGSRGNVHVRNTIKPGVLPVAAENLGAIFSILLSGTLIISLVLLLAAFSLELRRDTFSFEGLSVPRELLERGYSPVVISEEIISEIQKIQQAANTKHQRRNLESLMSLPDLQLTTGISMSSIVRYARRLLSLHENRISGKIVNDEDGMRLILVVHEGNRNESAEIRQNNGDMRALFKNAGRAIVQIVDGYVLASYLMDQEKPGGQFPATLSAIDFVLAHPPASDHPWALELLGLVRHIEGAEDQALEALRTLLSLYPNFEGGPAAYVQQLVYMDRIEEARHFSNTRRQSAQSAKEWQQVFWMTHNLGDWLGAVDAASKEITAGSANGYTDLFHGLGHAGRYKESLIIIEKGLAGDPKKFHAFSDGSLVAYTGRTQEGINLAKASISAAANSGNREKLALAYENLGDVLVIAGQPQLAMIEFQHAMDHGTAVWDMMFPYGDALIAVGRPQQALDFFNAKIREQPRVWDGHVGAARAQVALGNLLEANRLFELVARESPLDPVMFTDWAKCLKALGKVEDAENARQRSIQVAESMTRPLTSL